MPKVSEHKEARLRRIVRDAMAIDPLITMNGLQRAVEAKISRPIDEVYLKKLVKKVSAEMAVVLDREKVEPRIEQLRETNRVIREELFRIAFPSPTKIPQPEEAQRIRALDLIAKIDRSQLKLEMDMGVYTRHLGQLDIDHRMKPLDDDTRSGIIAAWRSWWENPPQMRKIEPRKTITVESTPIPNEPAKPQSRPVNATPAINATGLVPIE